MYNHGDQDAIDMAKEQLDELSDAIKAGDKEKINSALEEIKGHIEHLEAIIAVHYS